MKEQLKWVENRRGVYTFPNKQTLEAVLAVVLQLEEAAKENGFIFLFSATHDPKDLRLNIGGPEIVHRSLQQILDKFQITYLLNVTTDFGDIGFPPNQK